MLRLYQALQQIVQTAANLLNLFLPAFLNYLWFEDAALVFQGRACRLPQNYHLTTSPIEDRLCNFFYNVPTFYLQISATLTIEDSMLHSLTQIQLYNFNFQ